MGVEPVAWLAWVAPVPLLLLAFHSPAREGRWLVFMAALIGWSVNAPYYRLVMGLPMAVILVLLQSLLWRWVMTTTRDLVLRYQNGWAMFAYPVLWVAVDTLMAALLPDGNWASLAYSQSEVLPIVQVAALGGVPALLFLVALVPSALAFALSFGRRPAQSFAVYATTVALLLGALVFGEGRLAASSRGEDVTFGLASIDDAIGLEAQPRYIESILRGYEDHVAALARGGARVIVLPEKIGVQRPAQADLWRSRFASLAARHRVWLEVGIAVDDANSIVNLAWLFGPTGSLAATYQKHHLAPPERSYAKGDAFVTRAIDGAHYGLGICKDMHFASFGRAYATRVSVMLVPAWDFEIDAWMGARMTAVRGIEGGYTVVRASREGLLTVSDPYGRFVAQTKSATLPGVSLLASGRIGSPVWTLYSRTGDLLGPSSVLAAVWMLVALRRSVPRRRC